MFFGACPGSVRKQAHELNHLLTSFRTQVLVLLSIWMASMIFGAKFIISNSMILLAAVTLFEWNRAGGQRWPTWRRGLPNAWQQFRQQPAYWLLSVHFFLVLVSAAWSGDGAYTLQRLQIKLPFLVLPFLFIALPRLELRQQLQLLYVLLGLLLLAAGYVGWQYLAHYEQVQTQLSMGQPMPTPSNHIRFSLVLSFGILAGLSVWYQKLRLGFRHERWLLGVVVSLLFVFIHVLSVRTGLLTLYAGLGFLILREVYRQRRYAWGALALLLLAALPVLSYRLVPSFQMRLHYAYWDMSQYLSGAQPISSDSERFTSMQVGLEILRDYPWLGVGAGDLKREVRTRYAERFGPGHPVRMPHNQLLSTAAGTGIVGLLLFLLAFLAPLWHRPPQAAGLYGAFHLLIFLSFLIENTFENNYGISFYLLVLLVLMRRGEGQTH
jgi:O-antigen ligase